MFGKFNDVNPLPLLCDPLRKSEFVTYMNRMLFYCSHEWHAIARWIMSTYIALIKEKGNGKVIKLVDGETLQGFSITENTRRQKANPILYSRYFIL